MHTEYSSACTQTFTFGCDRDRILGHEVDDTLRRGLTLVDHQNIAEGLEEGLEEFLQPVLVLYGLQSLEQPLVVVEAALRFTQDLDDALSQSHAASNDTRARSLAVECYYMKLMSIGCSL